MLSLLFAICIIWFVGKFFIFGLRASWGIMKLLCTVIFFPVILIGMVIGGAVCLGNGTCLVLPRRYRRCAARHMRDGSARHSRHTDDTGILGPILAVILPMCAGKWGLAGRLRWWSGCGAIGRLRCPGYGRPTYISRGVRYTVNG